MNSQMYRYAKLSDSAPVLRGQMLASSQFHSRNVTRILLIQYSRTAVLLFSQTFPLLKGEHENILRHG